MTSWTLFFTMVGVSFLTAQLFRIIDLIERPARPFRHTAERQSAPSWRAAAFAALYRAETLLARWRTQQWTFWRS